MEITREDALDIVMRMEQAYRTGGPVGQVVFMMSTPNIAEAFQLLIDDGTIFRLVCTEVKSDPQYLMRQAFTLVREGICKMPEAEG